MSAKVAKIQVWPYTFLQNHPYVHIGTRHIPRSHYMSMRRLSRQGLEGMVVALQPGRAFALAFVIVKPLDIFNEVSGHFPALFVGTKLDIW